MKAFVLDASVALAWLIDDPVPSYATKIQERIADGEAALVPALWVLEMANGLLMAERRGKLAPSDADHGLRQLEAPDYGRHRSGYACGSYHPRGVYSGAYLRIDGV